MNAEGPVVFVNNSRETFTPTVSGAICTCLWEVARAAADAGAEVDVISPSADAAAYDVPRLTLIDLPAAAPPRADRVLRRATGWESLRQRTYARRVARLVADRGATTVLCNNDPQIAAFLAEELPGVTVVHWFHNLEVGTDRARRAYHRSRVRHVAVSAYLARAVEHAYGLALLTVAVAANGVDAARFTAADATAGDAAGGVPTVLFLGRIAVEKGVDVFLEAVGLLHERGHAFRSMLIGNTNWGFFDGGPYGTRIEAMVRTLRERGAELATPGHVSRADLPALLRAGDVQVVSSRWDEPAGLVTLEGMASGLALVATATGGTPELLYGAGVLVPRDDPAALADELAALLKDPDRRRHLGLQARARAEELTWRRTWDALWQAASEAAQ